jgi:choline dehydrogenase-like flavoprotein
MQTSKSIQTAAHRARVDLLYLSRREFRTLAALAEVVVMGEQEILIPEEVARNIDRYLAAFRARTKWLAKAALIGIERYPLLSFKPPFSKMKASDRLAFIKQRFYQDVTSRFIPRFWRQAVQGMIRMGKQLCYLGYYNDPRTFEAVGFIPFSQRKDKDERIRQRPIVAPLPLQVQDSAQIRSDKLSGDVIVIGSGAAGAVVAYGLVKAGREVLMLERGDYVDPRQFSEDEMEMFGKLYADGALQFTRDFQLQVLQGSCVGGTTVVNNAVCFDLPPEVLERWNDPRGLAAGLEAGLFWEALKQVRKLVGVERQNHSFLNKGAAQFKDGLKKLGLLAPPNEFAEVEANIHDCLGCGYCNNGCRYGKKLSMLDTLLPMTQKEFGAERLKIIAGCEAEKLKGKGKKIDSVLCRLANDRRIEIRGNAFVLCAGAISSSLVLLRSGVGGKQVGKNLAFNVTSPITAVFDDVVNAYDGLQVSHYFKPSPARGFAIETWASPPVTAVFTMPGWFEDHYENMRRFNRMANAAALVATQSNAQVRNAGLTGREIEYTPTREDFQKLLEGLMLIGEIFLEAGATSVLPHTFKYYEFTNKEQLRRLPALVKSSIDITLGSGHPQGGNNLSGSSKLGVVNPEFRVHGYDNVFVCDASVFPSSIGVNPQLTVMALAHYAAPFIAQSVK